MNKNEQAHINAKVLAILTDINRFCVTGDFKRLRSCSAEVAPVMDAETGELMYYVLRSYRTIVAAIDVSNDTLYDFLRYVYGYTSTSAQHISKFSHDYGAGKWGCAHRLTYYSV